jgi:hypothetical protein
MAITTLDGIIAAAKQKIPLVKTSARTTVAATWFSLFDLAGQPGAGTLAGSSTAAGVVPDATVAGFPTINAFGGGATGYLAKVDFGSSVAGRMALYDCLFKAGAYAFNAATALAAQPSYSARVPGGTDYTGTEIWIEFVTAFTGTLSVAVTYTNQSGTTAHTTGTVVTVAGTVGRLFQLPLAAGDTGVQKIESVTGTVATAGTFNVLVLRPLWTGRCRIANDGDVHDALRTGMVQVFATSAIYLMVATDSTSSGVPELQVTLANG